MRLSALAAMLLSLPLAAQAQMPQRQAKIYTHACEDRAFIEKYKDALVAYDKQAIMIAVTAMEMASEPGGDCIRIKEGESVEVLKSELFAGILTVRKRGRLGRYYALASFFQ